MRPQFRLRTLLFATFYVACIVAWLQWNWPTGQWAIEHFRPWRHYNPGAFGLAACGLMLFAAVEHWRGHFAGGWLVVGAIVASANHIDGVVRCFETMTIGGPYPDEVLDSLRFNMVRTLTLPIICFVPAVRILATMQRRIAYGDGLLAATLGATAMNVALINAGVWRIYSSLSN